MNPTLSNNAESCKSFPQQYASSAVPPRVPDNGLDEYFCLQRLSSLPSALYNEMVNRLFRGYSAVSIAEWLIGQRNRGGLNNVTSAHTLRQYIGFLARKVQRQKQLTSGPTMGELAASRLVPKREDLPVTVPWKNGQRFRTVEEYLAAHCKVFNRTTLAAGAALSNWEALERLRRWEEKNGEDRDIPLHAVAQGRAAISGALVDALEYLRRNDETELKKHTILGLDLTQFPVEIRDLLICVVGQLMVKADPLQAGKEGPVLDGHTIDPDKARLAVSIAEKIWAMIRMGVDNPNLLNEARSTLDGYAPPTEPR